MTFAALDRVFWRLLASAAAPAGARARLSTLIFHQVLAEPDPMRPGEPDAAAFNERMSWLAARFNVLPLGDAVDRLAAGTLPARALAITFDDGYADNARIAAPILQRLGVPATFFVATAYLDGGCMFNDVVITAAAGCTASELDLTALAPELRLGRFALGSTAARRALVDALLPALKPLPIERRTALAHRIAERAGVAVPAGLMMTSSEVAALAQQGFEIGAHTDQHPILAALSLPAARAEIQTSRRRLQALTGTPVNLFAYPNGRPHTDFSANTVALVRAAGFQAAVTTAPGVATASTDPFQIPRFTPWDRGHAAFGLRLARNALRAAPVEIVPTAVATA